jgi:hypothetical protein
MAPSKVSFLWRKTEEKWGEDVGGKEGKWGKTQRKGRAIITCLYKGRLEKPNHGMSSCPPEYTASLPTSS